MQLLRRRVCIEGRSNSIVADDATGRAFLSAGGVEEALEDFSVVAYLMQCSRGVAKLKVPGVH